MKFLPVALLSTLSLFISTQAHAACEKEVKAAEGASGEKLVPAFEKVATCDKKVAEQVFPQLMKGATDLDTLVALSLSAIEADIWNPVWAMPGKITDYQARDEVASAIGGACAEHPKVVAFLQGSYFGLRDIEFSQWDDGFIACADAPFEEWIRTQVENPPAKQYDEKWNALAGIYVKRKGAEALPALAQAGVKAANIGGPFEAILTAMDEAVSPSLGESITDADKQALEDALVGMAKQLPPQNARSIADRLSNSGATEAAASLLPTIYPKAVQPGGGFTYGAVSAEAGECKGTKTAVLHVANLHEGGTRYVLGSEAEGPMRTFKPKLKKCTLEGDWPVVVSSEPLSGKSDLDLFVAQLTKQWEGKGYVVRVQAEKDVTLP